MNSSPNDKTGSYRAGLDRLATLAPLRFPPTSWHICSTPSASAARRERLMSHLAAVGECSARPLAGVMTEALDPFAFALSEHGESHHAILAKTVSLDEWPDVIDKAPWSKGAKLRLFVDHKDTNGFHVIADLCPDPNAAEPTPEAIAIGIAIHCGAEERATAELRPNFPTRMLSPAIRAPLDDLALTIVPA
jgi:hypothetical protein